MTGPAAGGYPSCMTRVLVAVEGPTESSPALRAARRLFGDDATYVLVHVVPEPPEDPPPYRRADVTPVGIAPPGPVPALGFAAPSQLTGDTSAAIAAAEEAAEGTARDAARAIDGADVEVLGRAGDTAAAVVAAAKAHDADVIVVHPHGRGWVSRVFRHSVTDDIVRHADRPVLVVH